MTREQMMDNMIRRFGFEDNRTLLFCNLAEDSETADELLIGMYNAFMEV